MESRDPYQDVYGGIFTNNPQQQPHSNFGSNMMIQAPWSHVIPPAMPWAQTSAPPSFNPFTMEGGAQAQPMRIKRKLFPEEDCHQVKQYISEEKMAARFNQMQISNEYMEPKGQFASTCPVKNSSDTGGKGSIRSLLELEARLAESDIDEIEMNVNPNNSEPCMVLSPELRKLAKTDSILPQTILQEIRKPSMEVVLWKPPGGIIPNVITSRMDRKPSKSSEEEQDKKRSSV